MPRRSDARPPILAFEGPGAGAPRVEVQELDRHHASTAMGVHGHAFFELIYFRRGGGFHRVGGTRVPVRAGQVHLVPPGQVHETRELGRAQGTVVLFTPEALAPGTSASSFLLPGESPVLGAFLWAYRSGGGHLDLPRALRPRWEARLAELAAELEETATGHEEAARALLTLLLLDAARLAEPKLEGVPAASRPLLAEAFAFIHARFRHPISLQDVARHVGRSPAYLTDLVRRETGRSVLAWIVERRMAEAQRLLLETEEDVGAVGEAVSYLDTGYFIRQFRRHCGTTPAAWRRAHR